jgi:hypothetical protein
MDGDTLMIEATFHSHEDAQTQRQIVSERLTNGKEVAVSIGYGVDYNKVRHFESGKDLWDWCKEEGYDMNRFDKAISKEQGWCWVIPSVTELNEVSICNIGMNPSAKVIEVNSEPEQNDSGERMTLSDALDSALAAVERAKQVNEMRVKDGRTINPDRVSQLSAIQDSVSGLLQEINSPTQEEQKRAATVRQKLLLAKATLAGV